MNRIFDVRYLFSLRNVFGKSGGEISRKNNKGVLGRSWSKWMVLTAVSSTLKFQFTVNPESKRFDYSVRQNIGDLASIKLRTIFPLNSVLSKPPYGVKKSSFS